MSQFYDLASLVVIPSGYKASTIYAQKPLTTDGQLSFSRASTATRVNASGLIEAVASNVPRLDYLGSSCPRLLLEPQRTNNLLYSEQFNNAIWVTDGNGAGETKTANYAISPDGYQNADRIQLNRTGGSYSRVRQDYVAAGAHTASLYLKSNTGLSQKVWMRVDGSNATKITITTSWQRFVLSGSSSAGLELFIDSSDAEIATIADFSAWGAQIEAGSYATSYVPTTSASVTRVADAASKTGISSLIGQTEGTIFAEINFDLGVTPITDSRIQLSDGTTSNWIFIGMPDGVSSNLIRIYVNAPSGVMSSYSTNPVVNGVNKIAFGYKSGSFALYVNGVQAATNSATFTMATCSRIDLQGAIPAVAASERSNYNQVLLFKTRLTNAELAELTTL
jgi:hypothetical protein